MIDDSENDSSKLVLYQRAKRRAPRRSNVSIPFTGSIFQLRRAGRIRKCARPDYERSNLVEKTRILLRLAEGETPDEIIKTRGNAGMYLMVWR